MSDNNIKRKNPNLVPKGTVRGVELYQNPTDEQLYYKDKNGVAIPLTSASATIEEIVTNQAGIEAQKYLIYRALITQAGTANPTVVVLENTLGVTPTWERNDVGDYRMNTSGSGIFTDGATSVIINQPGFGGASVVKGIATASFYGDTSTLYVNTTDAAAAFAAVDGVLSQTYVEIRILIS